MGIFTTSRRKAPRSFSYEPRYYNPDRDESIKRRMRLKSRSRHQRRSRADLLYFLALLLFAAFLYIELT